MKTYRKFLLSAAVTLTIAISAPASVAAQPTRGGDYSALDSLLGMPEVGGPLRPRVDNVRVAGAQLPAQQDSSSEPSIAPPTTIETTPLPQDPVPALPPQATINWFRKITEISIDIRQGPERLPQDLSTQLNDYAITDWTAISGPELAYLWEAPNIRYGQLYFEDVALERYGQTRGPYHQVFRSAEHFFYSGVTMPIHMFVAPAGSCDTPLGYCRPGNCVDRVHQRFFYAR